LEVTAIRSRQQHLPTFALIFLSFCFSASAQFEARGTYRVEAFPSAMAVGDFDRDGNLDIAVADDLQSTHVSVFMGNGDGTFRAPALYSADNEPDAIAVADLNHDGIPDLIVGNYLSGDISVLLGKGDGTFTAANNYFVGSLGSLTAVAVGDFNGDGKLDVLAIDQNSACECLVTFLGNGDGTLQTGVKETLVGLSLSNMAVGDFNADGKLDVAVSELFFTTSQLQIFLGNGDGTFHPGETYLSGQGAFDVKAGRIDKDENLDLVVGIGGGFTTLIGNGDGSFRQGATIATSVYRLLLGDFSGEGYLDVAVVPSGPPATAGGVTVFTGNGDGSFQTGRNYDGGLRTSFAVAGDFNRDAQNDIAVIAGSGVSSYIVDLLNTGVLAFSPTAPLTFPSQLVGTSSPTQTVLLSNNGTSPLRIRSIVLKDASFKVETNCKSSLQPGKTCSINARFSPTGKGTQDGTINLTDSASFQPQTIVVSGAATVVQVNPAMLDFGAQKLGTLGPPLQIKLRNTASENLVISQIAITGMDFRDFSESNTCGSSLNAGASCVIAVSFRPSQKGVRNATVSVSDDGGASPQKINLSGTGIQN
jgi:hypothetical protein